MAQTGAGTRRGSAAAYRRRAARGQRVTATLLLGGLGAYIALTILLAHPLLAVALLALALVGGGLLLWRRGRARGRRLRRAATLEELRALAPSAFEAAVGDLLRAWGYHDVRQTGGAGDLGADLVCRDTRGARVVVQCKRYAAGASVTSPEMQLFIGMIYTHHRAAYGLYITTGGFTAPALALAARHNIRTVDGAALAAALAPSPPTPAREARRAS